jgi:hypothetical protein
MSDRMLCVSAEDYDRIFGPEKIVCKVCGLELTGDIVDQHRAAPCASITTCNNSAENDA